MERAFFVEEDSAIGIERLQCRICPVEAQERSSTDPSRFFFLIWVCDPAPHSSLSMNRQHASMLQLFKGLVRPAYMCFALRLGVCPQQDWLHSAVTAVSIILFNPLWERYMHARHDALVIIITPSEGDHDL